MAQKKTTPREDSEERPRSPREQQLQDDLHVHQVELELQNQELRRAKADLERSRARYFELFDFAPVGYFTFNQRSHIEALNLAAAELLQADRRHVLGSSLAQYLDSTSVPHFYEHLSAVFEHKKRQSVELVVRAVHRQPARHLQLFSQLVHGELNDAPLCLTAAVDITDRKHHEKEVQQLNESLEHRVAERTAELQQINDDLQAFTYSVSHDLRAPLRTVSNYADLLQEYSRLLPPEGRAYADRIAGGAEKMHKLIDALLALAHIGRQQLVKRATDLDELIDDVLSDLRHETASRNIQWRRQPLPVIDCDPQLMRQVFANLISNALKYTRPRDPAVIEIGSTVRDGESMLVVRDNGVGFDMTHRDKLFELFQRLHNSTEFEGSGVGLATAARIIRKHNGRIFAEGSPGRGAAFFVHIPTPVPRISPRVTTPTLDPDLRMLPHVPEAARRDGNGSTLRDSATPDVLRREGSRPPLSSR